MKRMIITALLMTAYMGGGLFLEKYLGMISPSLFSAYGFFFCGITVIVNNRFLE